MVTKNTSQGGSESPFGRDSAESRVIARIIAAWHYYSGHLENDFRRSIKAGYPTWRILRYERVLRPETQRFPVALKRYVRPKTFEMHLRYLKKNCRVVSLETLLNELSSPTPPLAHTVAITFDNGWVDNYHTAYPLLLKYNLPATIFLAPAYIGTINTFWPEKLMQTVLALFQKGFQLGHFSSIRDVFTDLEADTVENLSATLARTSALTEALKYLDPTARQIVFDELADAVDHVGGIEVDRTFMTWEEVQTLSTKGIQFGTQGGSHQVFSERDNVEIAADIDNSIRLMREKGVPSIPVFAFPEGVISKEGRETLSKLGIRYTLGIGYYQPPKDFTQGSVVLGRIPMYEAVSSCVELFALRLWKAGIPDLPKTND